MPFCHLAVSRGATSVAAALACIILAGISSARADIIWSDNFTGQTNGSSPSRDFTSNSSNDWFNLGDTTMLKVNTSLGNPSPALEFTDASIGALGNMRLAMNEFTAFSTSASTPILRLSFDWKIESFQSSLTSEAFRLILRANNSTALGDQVIIGFNRANLNDGDGSTSDLAWYAATAAGSSNIAATNSSAIGLDLGNGWLPGFNFGEHDFGSEAANDTDDLFYHFDLAYNYTSGAFNGTVTRLASDATNGQSASFSVAMNPNLVFSNTDANDMILIASTNGVTGVAQFDNFVVESVPEPAAGSVMLLGGLVLAGKRRRKSLLED